MKFKSIFFVAILSFVFLSACNNGNSQSTTKTDKEDATVNLELTNAFDSVSYAWGVNLGTYLKSQDYKSINLDLMNAALTDMLNGKELKFSDEIARQLIQAYGQKIMASKGEENRKESAAFLEANKKEEGVVTLPSGLQYIIMKKGNGPIPKSTDKVSVHYHGTLIDGTVFDSSVERGQPAEFGVTQVIKGWTEALQLMPVGSKWKLFIPADLAYGDHPRPGGVIEPGMALIFEVELLEIK